MAKGTGIKAYSPKPKAGGLAGFTSSQMRAQLANLGISPLSNPAKRVAGDQSYAVATYGTGLAGTVRKAFVGTRFAAQQEAVVSEAGKDQLQAGAQTIGEAMSIMSSGAKAQAAAAARAASLQMQQEAGASDSQAAAFAQQVYMAELQHRWAIQDQKRAEGAALRSATGQTQGIVSGVLQGASTITTGVQQAYMVAKDATEDGQPVSAGAIYQSFLANNTYPEGSPEAIYAANLAQQLAANGGNVEKSVEPALTSTFSGYAGFDPSMVAGAVNAGVSTQALSTRKEYIKANPGTVIGAPKVDPNAAAGAPTMLHPGQTPAMVGAPPGQYVYNPTLQKYVLASAPRA
jgi:hypothetical protein